MENASGKELEVARILHSLSELILQFHQCRRSHSHFPRWATKKTRARYFLQRKKPFSFNSERLDSRSTPPSLTNTQTCYVPFSAKKLEAGRSSPASPFHFCPSGDDTDNEPAVTAAAEASASTRPAKKIKLKGKELMKEHTNTACRLSEINKLLEQEKADYTKHHEALLEENIRLKMMLSKIKLAAAKTEQEHPHLLQQGHNEVRTKQTRPVPEGATSGKSFDRVHLSESEEMLTKTAPGLSPPLQPSAQMQLSIKQKPLFCPTTATPTIHQQFDPAVVRFSGFGSEYVGYIESRAQLVIGQLGLLDTRMAGAGLCQPSDAKRKATAEARKRRMQITRMKYAAAATTGSALRNATRVETAGYQR